MKNKKGKHWSFKIERDGFRSKPMTPADRRLARDIQLQERIANLDVMNPPGTKIVLGKTTYGVLNNYSWRKLPTL